MLLEPIAATMEVGELQRALCGVMEQVKLR